MYTDKTLTCRDCGANFVFTTGEQEFYASRGLTNEPGRCPECRSARRGRPGDYGGRGGYERREREMFPVTCSECGKATEVPFQPRSDRPVYCSECFEAHRPNASQSRPRGGGNRW